MPNLFTGPLDDLNNFFHPEKAYEAAQKQAQQGWNQAQQYQTPYWQQGLDQYGRLNQAGQNLLNPVELQNQWVQSYQTSPYAQQLLKQNQAQGLDAASAMGLTGSSAALGNIQQGAANIVNQDRQQFLNDLMQKYMAGIGLGQNLYGVGANTGANLGNQAFKQGENMAGLEYERQAAPSDLLGQIFGTALNYYKPGLGNAFSGQQGGNMYNQGSGY